MTQEEKAKIILKEVNEAYTIPVYMEKYVIKAIIAGLEKTGQQ